VVKEKERRFCRAWGSKRARNKNKNVGGLVRPTREGEKTKEEEEDEKRKEDGKDKWRSDGEEECLYDGREDSGNAHIKTEEKIKSLKKNYKKRSWC